MSIYILHVKHDRSRPSNPATTKRTKEADNNSEKHTYVNVQIDLLGKLEMMVQISYRISDFPKKLKIHLKPQEMSDFSKTYIYLFKKLENINTTCVHLFF